MINDSKNSFFFFEKMLTEPLLPKRRNNEVTHILRTSKA